MFTDNPLSKNIVNSRERLILNISRQPRISILDNRFVLDGDVEHNHRYIFGMQYIYDSSTKEFDAWHMVCFNTEISYDLYEAMEPLYDDFDVFLNTRTYINGETYIFNYEYEKFYKIKKYFAKYLPGVATKKIQYCNAMVRVDKMRL